eukprot:CAMPEP_0185265546 /NCGR_PEP_ID=MMETSP1359-20130426/27903_1 /TAXON_ID=552665 /ORGANISM="Bigelowiella longifila, Strain CCMP242" /LENGTH=264 /DNA_ID=CAMNT_0027854873 /DNA_START=37 /DNA_END=831 /DNA_ORIENTATION=-
MFGRGRGRRMGHLKPSRCDGQRSLSSSKSATPGSSNSRRSLGQSFNLDAIRCLGAAIRHPSFLIPHVNAYNVNEICFKTLKKAGIRAVVFDKDNTLTAPYGYEIHPSAKEGLARCLEEFGAENVVLMSNSAGTLDDKNFEEAKHIEMALGVPVLRHREKKPKGFVELMDHFPHKAIVRPESMCIVGDRVLTDVLFGSMYGLLTVHVNEPLGEKKDNQVARFMRTVENRILLPVLRLLGVSPTYHPALTSIDAGDGDSERQARKH